MDTRTAVLLVSGLAGLAYLPLLVSANGFCFDDPRCVYDFQQPHWTWTDRPLWMLLGRAFVRVAGLRRRLWLLVGLGLHAVNASLLMALARTLGADAWQATVAGALFAVHPMAVMSVALVAGSPSLLILTGILGGTWLWLDGYRVLAVLVGGILMAIKLDGWSYWLYLAGVTWCR